MSGGALPPADFARQPLPLAAEPASSLWQRIYKSVHPDPLGFGRSKSRFSDPTGTQFGLVYLGSSAKVAFAEVVLRDRAVATINPFPLSQSELDSYLCADIELGQILNLVDLTGDGHLLLRVPTDVTGASDQTLAQIWSKAFYEHSTKPDGVLYSSRLNEERNIALYDRAVGKLVARAAPRLAARPELGAILTDFNIALI
ncbi:MAG: RES family NAD+ phosphorylase [Reyranella sp.]|nr:RES family NAD+ phosphorylase [Reyranella sp.]